MDERATAMFRDRFDRYAALSAERGHEHAWETMLDGYPERQRLRMGPLIEGVPLADGFAKAIPLFRSMGMEMEVIDVSNAGTDGVLEIQKACPVLSLCREYGLTTPCRVVCEMDVEATRRAFPGMTGEILARQADGACVCVFKYERRSEEGVRPSGA